MAEFYCCDMHIVPAIILTITAFVPYWCPAQLMRSPLEMRYYGVGTYSRNFTDVFSIITNEAAVTNVTEAMAGVYTERRYNVEELNLCRGLVAFPVKGGSAAFTAGYTGSKGFNQSQLGIVYGKRLGEIADLGVQFNYNQVSIAGYGSAYALNAGIGSIFHINKSLHTGFHVYNLFNAGTLPSGPGERASTVFSTGFGYEASDKLFICAEASREGNQPASVNVALHYAFVKQCFVRVGMATSSASSFAGVGIKWQGFRTDISATWHPQLGFTPAFLIAFNLNRNQSKEE